MPLLADRYTRYTHTCVPTCRFFHAVFRASGLAILRLWYNVCCMYVSMGIRCADHLRVVTPFIIYPTINSILLNLVKINMQLTCTKTQAPRWRYQSDCPPGAYAGPQYPWTLYVCVYNVFMCVWIIYSIKYAHGGKKAFPTHHTIHHLYTFLHSSIYTPTWHTHT